MKKYLPDTNPDLRKEWHPEKNDAIQFEDLQPTSNLKVWWRCKHNKKHEWQAKVYYRAVKQVGCPFCSGRFVSFERSLAALFPDIAAEWHPTKNGGLEPHEVGPTSSKKVWWKCDTGHEWQSEVRNRTASRAKCKQCRLLENSLIVTQPKIAAEWHPNKNLPLTPEGITQGSQRQVWWRCQRGHEWKSRINDRIRGGGKCPKCPSEKQRQSARYKSITESAPDLASQWHPTLNLPLTPDEITPGSTKNKVWWVCSRNEKHIWQATPGNRLKGRNCPHCFKGPSLSDKFPGLAKEWHPSKNGGLQPTEVSFGSGKRVWWQCPNKHEFESTITNRTRKGPKQCPVCTGHTVTNETSLDFCHPEIAKEWHPTKNESLIPSDVSRASGKKAWWVCKQNPAHVWQSQIKNRTILGSGCPICGSKRLHEVLFESAQQNADFFNIFSNSMRSIRHISGQEFQKVLSVQQPIFRMVYASTITSMETYLCDAFLHRILNNDGLIDKLLTSVQEFKERKYSIIEILEWKNQIPRKVSDYLLDIVWHNLPKVKILYETVLGIDFPENTDNIYRFVAIRHDLVHRNGKMKSGKFHILRHLELESLFQEVERFIASINEQLIRSFGDSKSPK